MKAVAYYRCSTDDQHLGISAQKEIVRKYCEFNSVEIISEFEEHESGKKNDRPMLAKALSESVYNKAYLVVAKIDRLTRVAYFGLQSTKLFFAITQTWAHLSRAYILAWPSKNVSIFQFAPNKLFLN